MMVGETPLSDHRAYTLAAAEKLLAAAVVDTPYLARRMQIVNERSGSGKDINWDEVLDLKPPGRFLLVGEPGAGKSMHLARLAVDRLTQVTEKEVIVWQTMASYRMRTTLPQLLVTGTRSPEILEQFLQFGGVAILDAADEARAGDIGEVFDDILDWANDHRNVTLIVSCRAAEVPAWVTNEFRRLKLVPLTEPEISNALTAARDANPHQEVAARLYRLLAQPQLLSLYANPLLLGLALASLEDPQSDGVGMRVDSRADLYTLFMSRLERREEARAHLTDSDSRALFRLRPRALGWIAWKSVKEERAIFARDDLQRWLGEFLRIDSIAPQVANNPSITRLFDLIHASQPLKEIEERPKEAVRYSFVHASFNDYFAAQELRVSSLERGGLRAVSAVEMAAPITSRLFEIVYFVVASSADPDNELSELMTLATTTRDRDLLRSVAHVLSYDPRPKNDQVDDLLMRANDAFKYWERPFDYVLMYLVALRK